MTEYNVAPSNMTDLNVPAPYVLEYSANSGYGIYFAPFAGLSSFAYPNYCITGGGLPSWYKIDLATETTHYVTKFKMRATGQSGELNRMPKNFLFQGSNDNYNWYNLYIGTNVIDWEYSTYKTFICDTPGKYRYFRWYSIENNGDSTYTDYVQMEIIADDSYSTGSDYEDGEDLLCRTKEVWGDNNRKPAHLWTFDNISGSTVYDEVNNGLNLTLSGTRAAVVGWSGNALSGGTTLGNYCYLSAETAFKAISFWTRRLDITKYGMLLFGVGATKAMAVRSSGDTESNKIYFYNSGNVFTNLLISDTGWHNIILVEGSDSDHHWVYLDGVKSSTEYNTGIASMRYFGRADDGGVSQENMLFDNIQWYDFIPTDKEIQFLATATNQTRTLHVIGDIETDDVVEPYLWLESDDSAYITIATGVSKWWNKVGGGKHFIQNTTSYQPNISPGSQNGSDRIHFDGVDDYLYTSDFGSLTDIISIVVYNRTSTGGSGDVTWGRLLSSGPAGTSDYQSSGIYHSPSNDPVSGAMIVNYGVNTYSWAGVRNFDVFRLGVLNTNTTANKYYGDICAILIIPSNTPQEKIDKLYAWLHWKWGMVDKLYSWSLYKENPFFLNDVGYSKEVTWDNGYPWVNQYNKNLSAQTDITGWAVNGTNFPVPIAEGSIFCTNKYVYHCGGNISSGEVNSVYRAPINDDGSIGTFVLQSSYALPTISSDRNTPIMVNDRVYLFNGRSSGSPVNTVFYNKIDENGTLAQYWSNSSFVFPISVRRTSKFVIGNHIYFVGGYATTNINSVYRAPINDDGSIGTFVLQSETLPETMASGSSAIVTSSKVYIPFQNAAGTHLMVCSYDSTGLIGSWSIVTISLAFRMDVFAVVCTRNRVFLFGGYDRINANPSNITLNAPILSDGTIGTWVAGTQMVGYKSNAQAFVTNSKVYLVGGYDTGTIFSNTILVADFTGLENYYLDKTYSYTVTRTDDSSVIALRAALIQTYKMRDILYANLIQPYPLTNNFITTLGQLYSIRLLAALVQPLGSASQLRNTLDQGYSNSAPLRRTFDMLWGDSPKYRASLEQLCNLQDGLRSSLIQPYSITKEVVRAVMDQLSDLQDKDVVRTVLDMLYVIAAGESLVQAFDIAVVCDTAKHKSISNINIEQDSGSYYMAGELQLYDAEEYIQYKKFESNVSITVNNWTVDMIPEIPRSSRQPGVSTYIVPLVSKTRLLDSPFSNLSARVLSGMASAIVADLAAPFSIDWRLVDWFIPSGVLSVNDGDSAINTIRRITEAVGGVIQTTPDNILVCRPEYPVSVNQWNTTVPDYNLTDQDDFFQIDFSPDDRLGYNVFNVSDSQLSADGISMEPKTIDDFTVEYRVWAVPWDDNTKINLLHSGDPSRVNIVAHGVVTETVSKELVEIVEGSGSLANNSFFSLDSYEYNEVELGVVDIKEGGSVTTATAGNSLMYVNYKIRFWLFTVTDHNAETVQFFPEEVPV